MDIYTGQTDQKRKKISFLSVRAVRQAVLKSDQYCWGRKKAYNSPLTISITPSRSLSVEAFHYHSTGHRFFGVEEKYNDDEMASICKRLETTDLEKEELVVDINSVAEVMDRGNTCLLVKLLTSKYFNREAFKATMRRVWCPANPVHFHDMGEGLLMTEFESNGDKIILTQDGP